MVIIHGSRHYGKCDHVPGLFYVSTEFIHLYFLPVLPIGTYVMLDNDGYQGCRIGFSIKSWLLGWLRAVLWIAAPVWFGLGVVSLIMKLKDPNIPNTWQLIGGELATGLIAALLLYLSYRFTRAGPRRALELAAHLGIPPEEVAHYFAAHPNIESIIEELKHEQ